MHAYALKFTLTFLYEEHTGSLFPLYYLCNVSMSSCPSVQLVGWCTCRKTVVYEGVKG